MEHVKYLHNSFVWCSASISNSESLITQSYCVIAKLLLEEGRAWAGTNSPIPASSNSIGRKTNMKPTNMMRTNMKKTNTTKTNMKPTNMKQTNMKQTNTKKTNTKQTNMKSTNMKLTNIKQTKCSKQKPVHPDSSWSAIR